VAAGAPSDPSTLALPEVPGLPDGFDRAWLDRLPPPHRGTFLLRPVPGRVHLLLIQDPVVEALEELEATLDAAFVPDEPEVVRLAEARCRDGAALVVGTDVRRVAGSRRAERGGPLTVVGAGLAGACVARQLADHGVAVRVVDRSAPDAQPGSSNPWLLCRPHLAAGPHRLAALTRAGWSLRELYGPALQPLRAFAMAPRDGKRSGHHHKILERWRGSPWLMPLPEPLDDGYAQTEAGLLDGPAAIRHLLRDIEVEWGGPVPTGPVVWCTGGPPEGLGLTTHPVAGTVIRTDRRVLDRVAVAGGRYLADTPGGTVVGATRHRGTAARPDDPETLVQAAATRFGLDVGAPAAAWSGVRTKSPDHLPIVGWVEGSAVSVAHGSKGSVTAPIAAALVVAQWLGLPWPVPRSVARALEPARVAGRRPME